jgi:hypothetical protein
MKSVTITLNEDGTYSVSSGQEAAEGMPEPQTFESADEACEAAIGMLGGSYEEEPMIDGEEELQASFEGGFKQARGV